MQHFNAMHMESRKIRVYRINPSLWDGKKERSEERARERFNNLVLMDRGACDRLLKGIPEVMPSSEEEHSEQGPLSAVGGMPLGV